MTPHSENEMGMSSYKSVLPVALKLGLTTEEKYGAYLQELDSMKNKELYYLLWPLCIGVWKKKPN